MWFSAIKLALNAGTHIYKKRQETKNFVKRNLKDKKKKKKKKKKVENE